MKTAKSQRSQLVNVGTPERPIWVSEKALQPETKEGGEWWAMIAEGSVVLKPEVLDRLLEVTESEKS